MYLNKHRTLDKREYLMIIFLNSHRNHMTICCGPSFELSRQDGSDEGSQHMFLCRINKNYPYLSPNTPSLLEL